MSSQSSQDQDQDMPDANVINGDTPPSVEHLEQEAGQEDGQEIGQEGGGQELSAEEIAAAAIDEDILDAWSERRIHVVCSLLPSLFLYLFVIH